MAAHSQRSLARWRVRGWAPMADGRWQIVAFEVPIELSGTEGPVQVNPGDILFADPDGVLVLSEKSALEICQKAEARSEKEDLVRRRLLLTEDIQRLYDEVGRW